MRALHSDRTYVVSKTELLEKMEANRAAHRDVFERAIVAYRAEAIRQLDERLEAAKAGRSINLRFNLPQPSDHTKDYDRVIGLMKMVIEDEVQITEGQYQCYVMDEWDWSAQFETVNSTYLGTR